MLHETKDFHLSPSVWMIFNQRAQTSLRVLFQPTMAAVIACNRFIFRHHYTCSLRVIYCTWCFKQNLFNFSIVIARGPSDSHTWNVKWRPFSCEVLFFLGIKQQRLTRSNKSLSLSVVFLFLKIFRSPVLVAINVFFVITNGFFFMSPSCFDIPHAQLIRTQRNHFFPPFSHEG